VSFLLSAAHRWRRVLHRGRAGIPISKLGVRCLVIKPRAARGMALIIKIALRANLFWKMGEVNQYFSRYARLIKPALRTVIKG